MSSALTQQFEVGCRHWLLAPYFYSRHASVGWHDNNNSQYLHQIKNCLP